MKEWLICQNIKECLLFVLVCYILSVILFDEKFAVTSILRLKLLFVFNFFLYHEIKVEIISHQALAE